MATNDPSQVLPATNDPFSGEDEPFGFMLNLHLATADDHDDQSKAALTLSQEVPTIVDPGGIT